MINAGIKELKNNLSRYLSQVKAGAEIQITERGKPIARIVKEYRGRQLSRIALRPLVENGLIVLPSRQINKDQLVAVKITGKHASEIVIEDRR